MSFTRLTVPRSSHELCTTRHSETNCDLLHDLEVPDLSSFSDSSILPEELATQSVRLKEEQLRREEEKVRFMLQLSLTLLISIEQLREIELRVQREINEKRQELLAKEESLRCVVDVADFCLLPGQHLIKRKIGTSRVDLRLRALSRSSASRHPWHLQAKWHAMLRYPVRKDCSASPYVLFI